MGPTRWSRTQLPFPLPHTLTLVLVPRAGGHMCGGWGALWQLVVLILVPQEPGVLELPPLRLVLIPAPLLPLVGLLLSAMGLMLSLLRGHGLHVVAALRLLQRTQQRTHLHHTATTGTQTQWFVLHSCNVDMGRTTLAYTPHMLLAEQCEGLGL